ncbi:hypothetical protein WICMUC_004386 [Wickerhamomyces mucosus]|uniref:DUF2423 domain-containing protein n=1 Tax=Wickerhamomyces mucosus TaxID=1378264 RepID=A0A9P8TBL4_9ASCO|nr:hypothetical protein WICMUC_004386 [Wickerhamomyces mucosus]
MAKSLRSKSKLRFKSIKRGKEFQTAVDERQKRLHEKAKEDLINQKLQEIKNQNNTEGDDIAIDNDDQDQDETKTESSTEVKKVSTSGYRTARHHLYKKNNKKKNHTSFGKK